VYVTLTSDLEWIHDCIVSSLGENVTGATTADGSEVMVQMMTLTTEETFHMRENTVEKTVESNYESYELK